jgi:hypothetical protein
MGIEKVEKLTAKSAGMLETSPNPINSVRSRCSKKV